VVALIGQRQCGKTTLARQIEPLRDLPQLVITIPAPALLRFWTMMAHCHGSIWSAADPARSLGIGESTIRCYLDLFTKLLVVRQLQPLHENLGKRQVKAPKVYVRDSGLLHALLGIRTRSKPSTRIPTRQMQSIRCVDREPTIAPRRNIVHSSACPTTRLPIG